MAHYFYLRLIFVWLVSSLARIFAPAKQVCASRHITYPIYLQLPIILRSKVLLVHSRNNCSLDEEILLKGGSHDMSEIK